MTRINDYTSNYRGSILTHELELIGPDGALWASSSEASSAASGVHRMEPEGLTLSTTRGGRSRALTGFSLVVTDRDLIDRLDPLARGRVRHRAGIIPRAGSDMLWLQSTQALASLTVVSSQGVTTASVQLLDPSSRLDVTLASRLEWSDNSDIGAIVASAMSAAGLCSPFDYVEASTGFTLPAGGIDPDQNVLSFVREILTSCGWALTVNAQGVLVPTIIASVSPDPGREAWIYGGATGIPIRKITERREAREPQGVLVETRGDSPQPVSTRVFDTDPSSRSRYSPDGNPVMLGFESEFIANRAQAIAAGYGVLLTAGSGPGLLTIESIPNPALQVGDPISITDSGRGFTDQLAQVVWIDSQPADASSPATFTVQLPWNPAVNSDPLPVDIATSFETAFSDDFNRPDEDMQSSNWAELAYSWGIVANRAVQRFTGGYSMVIYRAPLSVADHSCTVVVAACPEGSRIGPVIRSDASAAGFVALIDHRGVITLESWVGNQPDGDPLGRYESGVPPDGQTLKLQVLDGLVTVDLNGATVISTASAKHLGAHAGALALGAPESIAPAIDSISIAVAT